MVYGTVTTDARLCAKLDHVNRVCGAVLLSKANKKQVA